MFALLGAADLSGVPGTGKTATVYQAVRELEAQMRDEVSTIQNYLS